MFTFKVNKWSITVDCSVLYSLKLVKLQLVITSYILQVWSCKQQQKKKSHCRQSGVSAIVGIILRLLIMIVLIYRSLIT